MSEAIAHSLRKIMFDPEGIPQNTDFALLVRPARSPRAAHSITLEIQGVTGIRARVYSNEWYPGRQGRLPWSHYFNVLRTSLMGLEKSARQRYLRLQVLKAVKVIIAGEPVLVLLKFIVAPEYTVAATDIEEAYGCSLRSFYTGFVGVAPDPRTRPGNAEWLVGNAIHEGYRAAAQAFVQGKDVSGIRQDYLEAVVDTYLQNLPHLARVSSRGPTRLHRRPLEVMEDVIRRCREQWDEKTPTELLQERLFFSPARGMMGRADRVSCMDNLIYLHEVKTGSAIGEKDPRTGRRIPGGIQAAAYFQIMDSYGKRPDGVFVEQLSLANDWEEVPLRQHPVIQRATTSKGQSGYDVYLDLLAQSRNAAYVLESGLLSGYDRTVINAIGSAGRTPRGLVSNHELESSATPCNTCEANARNICPVANPSSPLAGTLFKYMPRTLWEYWGWFHSTLKREDNAAREALYNLVNTPTQQLERSEGVTIFGLRVTSIAGRNVELSRDSRIDTRIREDDPVLLTPEHVAPGEIHSLEGTVAGVGERSMRLRINDAIQLDQRSYRVDRLGHWQTGSWQVEGLADFIIRGVCEAQVAGRELALEDLPPMVQRLLGTLPVSTPKPLALPSTPELNEDHLIAVSSALTMEPGDVMMVQGPPGTGKTAMIAHLVHQTVSRRFLSKGHKPVLVLANTHRAADEITSRVHRLFPELRPYLIRVGNPRYGTEPNVSEHTLVELLDARDRLGPQTFASDGPQTLHRIATESKLRLDNASIFIGTLAAARAGELRGYEFDWVIVDEAGQATEPATLQAIRHMPDGFESRLLLVGDHMQLPPVVQDEMAAPEITEELKSLRVSPDRPLARSLFERLASLHPDKVTTLRKQYRMNRTINELVSDTFYNRLLIPGTEEVARRSLGDMVSGLGGTASPSLILNPEQPVVLIDTSLDPRAQEQSGNSEESKANVFEARLIARLVLELSECVPQEGLGELLERSGVISAYRRQNNLIQQELTRLDPALATVRVDTVDRFQGGERDVVLISLVNSDPMKGIGSLHADARRMNVAISRARRKLIIVGNRRTFTESTIPSEEQARNLYRRMFATIERLEARQLALVTDSRSLL